MIPEDQLKNFLDVTEKLQNAALWRLQVIPVPIKNGAVEVGTVNVYVVRAEVCEVIQELLKEAAYRIRPRITTMAMVECPRCGGEMYCKPSRLYDRCNECLYQEMIDAAGYLQSKTNLYQEMIDVVDYLQGKTKESDV